MDLLKEVGMRTLTTVVVISQHAMQFSLPAHAAVLRALSRASCPRKSAETSSHFPSLASTDYDAKANHIL